MNLNQVTVPSLNVPESIEFYKKLGLKLIVHTHDAYARFECPNGDSTFSIHQVEEKVQSPNPVIYFECEDLDKKVESLIKLGVKFSQTPKDMDWLWREAHLKDPFGNELILFTAGKNRKDPPWKLKS